MGQDCRQLVATEGAIFQELPVALPVARSGPSSAAGAVRRWSDSIAGSAIWRLSPQVMAAGNEAGSHVRRGRRTLSH